MTITAMTITERIREKLNKAFSPLTLELVDDSDQHKGHGGYREGGETHFRLLIVSDHFTGQGRVLRQRAIYDSLQVEMAERVHALQITARTPLEQAALQAAPERS